MPRCLTWCCTADAAPGRTRCAPCLAKVRAAQKARRAGRLLAGLCIQCDATPVPGQRRCERHRALLKESWERAKAAKFAARWERQHRRQVGEG